MIPATPTVTSSDPIQDPENTASDNSRVHDIATPSSETQDTSLTHHNNTLGETPSVSCSSHRLTLDIYNVHPGGQTTTSARQPKSRNKRKCIRKKRRVASKIDEYAYLPGEEDAQRPKSRCKVRCRFGPLKRQGGPSSRSTFPSLWYTRLNARRWDASSSYLPIDELNDLEIAQADASPLPDRVTLRPVSPTRQNPFEHYLSHTVPAQRVNPYEHSIRKLGITEEQFAECINEDIDSILKEFTDSPSAHHSGNKTRRTQPDRSKPGTKNSKKYPRRKRSVATNTYAGGSSNATKCNQAPSGVSPRVPTDIPLEDRKGDPFTRTTPSFIWNSRRSIQRWDASSPHLPIDELHELEIATTTMGANKNVFETCSFPTKSVSIHLEQP